MNAICTRYFGWKAGSAQKTQTRGRRVGAVAPVSPGLVVKRQSYKCGGLRSRNTGVEVWREYGERAVRLVRPVEGISKKHCRAQTEDSRKQATYVYSDIP